MVSRGWWHPQAGCRWNLKFHYLSLCHDGFVIDVSSVCEFMGSNCALGGWNNSVRHTHDVVQAHVNVKNNKFLCIYIYTYIYVYVYVYIHIYILARLFSQTWHECQCRRQCQLPGCILSGRLLRSDFQGAKYPIWDCSLIKNCGHVRDMVDF